MQFVHHLDACAVLDFEQSLLLEAFGGLAHNGAAYAQLFSEGPLRRQPALIFCSTSANKLCELLTNACNK